MLSSSNKALKQTTQAPGMINSEDNSQAVGWLGDGTNQLSWFSQDWSETSSIKTWNVQRKLEQVGHPTWKAPLDKGETEIRGWKVKWEPKSSAVGFEVF